MIKSPDTKSTEAGEIYQSSRNSGEPRIIRSRRQQWIKREEVMREEDVLGAAEVGVFIAECEHVKGTR